MATAWWWKQEARDGGVSGGHGQVRSEVLVSNGTWLTKCGGGYLGSGPRPKSASQRPQGRAARMGQKAPQ